MTTKKDGMEEAREYIRENTGFFDFPRPWLIKTAELYREEESVHADYSAWKCWMDNQFQIPCTSGCSDEWPCAYCKLAEWWDSLEMSEEHHLFHVISTACEETARAMGWKEAT